MSRSDIPAPPSGRKRSNTAHSIFGNVPVSALPPPISALPLQIGDSRVLTVWVNEPGTTGVKLNHKHCGGVAEGDLICIASPLPEHQPGFLFVAPAEDSGLKHQLQAVLEMFGLKSNSEVTLTKMDQDKYSADFVEFVFQDQYLSRNDMWRLARDLVGQCLYIDQQVSFIGVIAAKVQALYSNGMKVSSAYFSPATKVVYRSLSAKVTIFIQVCRELWEFAGDGERYNEKIMNTNHIVTIVLISRVYYDQSEVDYAAGPLRRDEDGRWYKDFYKVITDLEVLYDWRPTLVALKDSFWAFQRDILLAHHYHRSNVSSPAGGDAQEHVRLVGQISYAHDGPVLEALNLALKPTETHFIDRSLSLTGLSTVIITPGTGYFRVSKQLLRLTTSRVLDQGFSIDLVSLAKPPLHQTPIFCFKGVEPEAGVGKAGPRAHDSLWGGDAEGPSREVKTFWWEPFWMETSFWDRQMDLPFRKDRFVSRAKMHEIEMLGLLDHDVLSSIEIPYLQAPDGVDMSSHAWTSDMADSDLYTSGSFERKAEPLSPVEADQFDNDVFTIPLDVKPPTARNSLSSTSSGPPWGSSGSALSSSFRGHDKRASIVRISDTNRIHPIEESPRPPQRSLSRDIVRPDKEQRLSVTISGGNLSTSPSQASVLSGRSARSQRSRMSNESKASDHSATRSSGISKFASTWLLNQFRSVISEPQTSSVSASGSAIPPPRVPRRAPSQRPPQPQRPPRPVPTAARPIRPRPKEDELPVPHRGSLTRHSPVGTPPRDDILGKRRGTIASVASLPIHPANLAISLHPTRPLAIVPYAQASLARRWQHLFPRALTKHEIKWWSMATPACLPLTVEYFPSVHDLENSYDVFSYDFVCDPELRSILVRPPPTSGSADEVRSAYALATMRVLAAMRLAQGFQFVLRPSKRARDQESGGGGGVGSAQDLSLRRTKSYAAAGDNDAGARPVGVATALGSAYDSVYLTMSNEIHHIVYTGDVIQVRRYVRRMPKMPPFEYQCLIWPKLGEGYTELRTTFGALGLENYGWNPLDMFIGGYGHSMDKNLRYWRTRFVVIPADESPHASVAPGGERLNEEETRLLGMDKLAELFSKARIESDPHTPPIRFITTDLGPAECILDEGVLAQLDDIHASGPLKKKVKSERDIADMSLATIAKVMREEDGVPIKEHRWHGRKYPNSFTGTHFVTWLVREFRDISNREEGAEWGAKLMEDGLFDHCRSTHGFLDGHYFYILRGEYIIPVTPRASWFSRPARHDDFNARGSNSPRSLQPGKRTKKRKLVLSQNVNIDVDPRKQSDQAESVILHHDIIHNPGTCFHFEFNWIGTTARCIDDLLRQWSRIIERYGLKLVEAYVDQISDVRAKNAFQSCFPIPLAIPPPRLDEVGRHLPEGTQAKNYFETTILRKSGFVLDIEGIDHYTDQVEVEYSYRLAHFKYSQWVHRSGVAFVQVLGGSQGFLFLTNRLMAPGRIGTSLKYQRPAAAAEELRRKLHQFCSDKEALRRFYDEELAQLDHTLEEPPPLRI
uniref:Vacuolar membrane-associated protein IML1 n=1 Tax=Ganoderma boninense TaxID=34458 RepID=A0A5K1K7F7_9APHY|nr:Atg26p [Ganoderma boninense]